MVNVTVTLQSLSSRLLSGRCSVTPPAGDGVGVASRDLHSGWTEADLNSPLISHHPEQG